MANIKLEDLQVRYFSFGENHAVPFAHKRGMVVIDKDILVKITHKNPREEMQRIFGDKWDHEYEELPNMKYFKRGIFDVRLSRMVAR